MPKGKTNNPNGRPKGSQNQHTKAFKELLIETYQALENNEGKGEKEAKTGLLQFAKDHPRDFYKICAKLVPAQMTIDLPDDKKFSLTIE